MRKFLQKNHSIQTEEFNLHDIDHETKKHRPPVDEGHKNGISRNHCSIPKSRNSRNEPKNRRWYSRKQKIDTNGMETATCTPLNNTRDEHIYSDDHRSYGLKRMCRVSKKTELVLGRITLISTIIALVTVTNFGSLSIYIPSVIPKNHTGHIKALARNTLTNDSQANEGVSIQLDDVPKLDATNPYTEKIINLKTPKVSIFYLKR